MASLGTLFNRGTTPAFVWISIITGLLVMLIFFVGVGFEFYRSTVLSAEQESTNIATLVEQDIGRNIELYDLSIQAVLDGMNDEEVMHESPRVRQMTLFDRSATAPGLGLRSSVAASSTSTRSRPASCSGGSTPAQATSLSGALSSTMCPSSREPRPGLIGTIGTPAPRAPSTATHSSRVGSAHTATRLAPASRAAITAAARLNSA